VTEVGTSNVFFYWKNEKGEEEVVTPAADDLILHGVTRHSVLSLLRDMKRFKVTERHISIKEVVKAIEENRLIEAFSSGTAVTIGPIK
jgi:branched-chain amino acid aminotransferase